MRCCNIPEHWMRSAWSLGLLSCLLLGLAAANEDAAVGVIPAAPATGSPPAPATALPVQAPSAAGLPIHSQQLFSASKIGAPPTESAFTPQLPTRPIQSFQNPVMAAAKVFPHPGAMDAQAPRLMQPAQPVMDAQAPHLMQPAQPVTEEQARNHIQQMQQQFSKMHPIAEMAAKGMLPANPPAMFAQQHNMPQSGQGMSQSQMGFLHGPSGSSDWTQQHSPAGAPALLPPPLLPQHNMGPSPQFQEMIKRLEKEHGGKLPPGLGAFTAPPPLTGGERSHAPGSVHDAAAASLGGGMPPMMPPPAAGPHGLPAGGLPGMGNMPPVPLGMPQGGQRLQGMAMTLPPIPPGKSDIPPAAAPGMPPGLGMPMGMGLPPGVAPPGMPTQPNAGKGQPGTMPDPTGVLPSMALPRELPAQPKGPSIQQILEIQREHQEHQKKDSDKEKGLKKSSTKANKNDESEIPFRSDLVDSTVDDWIDHQIAKKSTFFKHRLGKIYKKQQERAAQQFGGADHGMIANDYDPDGTVFLSKVSNVLSTEHPDMSSRLDNWIDRQVDASMRQHHVHGKRRRGDEDDDGNVWLQDALEKSDEESDEETIGQTLSRDFAKGIFYSSSSKNKKEFGSGMRPEQTAQAQVEAEGHRGHRKFKRRRGSSDDQTTAVLLELDATTGTASKSKWKANDKHIFSVPVSHDFNWNPHDNRYRLDRDTNVQDPEYVEYPLHKVIDKTRRHGGASKNKQAKKSLDKWVDLATGRGKDPLDGMFVEGSYDFEQGDASDEAAVYDLEKLIDQMEKTHARNASPSLSKRNGAARYSQVWGD